MRFPAFSRCGDLTTCTAQLAPDEFVILAGPYQVNGVPLRRVNQAYVIATSMKVNLSKVTIPVQDDSYFKRVSAAKKTEEDQFFEQGSKVGFFYVNRRAVGMLDAMRDNSEGAYRGKKGKTPVTIACPQGWNVRVTTRTEHKASRVRSPEQGCIIASLRWFMV